MEIKTAIIIQSATTDKDEKPVGAVPKIRQKIFCISNDGDWFGGVFGIDDSGKGWVYGMNSLDMRWYSITKWFVVNGVFL